MSQLQIRHRNVAILSLVGFQKLEAAISQTDIWNYDTKSCTLEALSQITGLSTHTLSKVHARKAGVDLRTLIRYFRAFNLTLETSDYFSPIRMNQTPVPFKFSSSNGKSPNLAVSWGLAPDVSVFYGRTSELTTLSHWVLEERCRLVTLIGMGGIGKTWLATKLTEQVQHRFQSVIWRSLRTMSDTPTCKDLLDDLIRHLAPESESNLPAAIYAKMCFLIDCLRQTRCLLVLDNAESILPGHISGNGVTETVQSSCEEYGELLGYLCQGRHQSCVVLTGREKPKRVQQLSGDNSKIRVLPITGLPLAEAQQLLRARGVFQGSAAEWHRLIAYYGGNPLFLEILAVTIKDLFDGSLTAFFSHNTLILDEIRELLDRQFDCLSPSEHNVMKVLAERDTSLSFAELRSQISPNISTSVLLAVLKSLKARSLIEKNTTYISLQLLLRDYLRERYQCRVSILVPTPIC